jgi:hypothetical protein
MKVFIIAHWMEADEFTPNVFFPDAELFELELVQSGDKYYLNNPKNNLNLTVNPPNGHITWEDNIGSYQLGSLTDKGLVYTVTPPAGGTHSFLIQLVR